MGGGGGISKGGTNVRRERRKAVGGWMEGKTEKKANEKRDGTRVFLHMSPEYQADCAALHPDETKPPSTFTLFGFFVVVFVFSPFPPSIFMHKFS